MTYLAQAVAPTDMSSLTEIVRASLDPIKYKVVGAFGALLLVEAGVLVLGKARDRFVAFLAQRKAERQPGYQHTLF